MKNLRLSIDTDHVAESFKDSLFWTMVGYGVMYELLHKQLWRKNRVALIDHELTVKGRPCKPIKWWNIKSPSKAPYSRDDAPLGLNQLFVGQNPREEFDGDPADDGIYHDDCLIQPKFEALPSYDRYGWYIEGNGYWTEKDVWGQQETLNVTSYEKFETVYHDAVYDAQGNETSPAWSEEVSLGWYYAVETPTETNEYPLQKVWHSSSDDGEYVLPPVEYVNFCKENRADIPALAQYVALPDMSDHGSLIFETTDIPKIRPKGTTSLVFAIQLSETNESLVRVYADGTAVKFSAPTTWTKTGGEDGGLQYADGYIQYLPLCYTDTGDLVQNRVDFIDDWDDMFELYVHEEGYWYQDFAKIVVLAIATIIAYFSAGTLAKPAYATAFAVIAAFSAFTGTVGAIMGNQTLQIIGLIGSLVSFAGALAREGSKEMLKQEIVKALNASMMSGAEATAIAETIVANAPFWEQFAAGFAAQSLGAMSSSVLELGSIGYEMYSTITAPSISTVVSEVTEGTNDMNVSVSLYSSSEDDVMDVILL